MQIYSDIAPLKEVILHNPIGALQHLTPENCQRLLFDDVLWVEKAVEDHECFQQLLRDNGVDVLLLETLLAETLAIAQAKEWLIYQSLDRHYRGSLFYDVLYAHLMGLDNQALAATLLNGLPVAEIDIPGKSLVGCVMHPTDFVLPPLPNHLFTRDTTAWVGNGVCINPMRYQARRSEALNLAAIYKFHPRFSERSFHVWIDGVDEGKHLPHIEGGDVMVLSQKCLLVGFGQRTQPQAVEHLARKLFGHSSFDHIIAIEVPNERASMHLDTVLTMATHDTFCAAFPHDEVRSWSLKPGDALGELVITEEKELFAGIANALDVKKLNVIKPAGSYYEGRREQWNDASNLLTIKPGVCVVYDRNVAMNKKLRDEGIEALEIPGAELGRGRGGARCMSCPTIRETS